MEPSSVTITVGYGEGDEVNSTEVFTATADAYDVHITEGGTLKVSVGLGNHRFYADGFWKYVDVDIDEDNGE